MATKLKENQNLCSQEGCLKIGKYLVQPFGIYCSEHKIEAQKVLHQTLNHIQNNPKWYDEIQEKANDKFLNQDFDENKKIDD